MAAVAPTLLAFNVAPSPTFLNQALAFIGWGFVACVMGWIASLDHARQRLAWRATMLPGVSTAVIGAAAAVSWFWGSLPSALALSGIATLLATYVLLAAGAWAGTLPPERARHVFAIFCLAWLVGGLLNAVIAGVQVFAPDWTDGAWIARSALPGRAVGNLRQPNHVCTLLLWSAISAVALHELKVLSLRVAVPALALIAAALVLTASRSAILGLGLLALWGLADRRLSGRGRALLLAAPVFYALAWAATAAWAGMTHEAFGAQDRLAEADLSASRFRIWSDTLQLIAQNPLLGVGYGEFNFAWSLTPLPHRPPAFFDHAHNLELQWAVEYGIPVALVLSAVLALTLIRMARAAASTQDRNRALMLRCTLAYLLLIALHSQLEYPLWYAYFLLPTAFLVGFGHAQAMLDRQDANDSLPGDVATPALLVGGAAVVLGTLAAVADYARVASIFDSQSSIPLAERIERGQRSFFFAHHADYAAATTSDQPRQELSSFGNAAHYLLDTRLMMAWSQAWAATGDLARARYLASRLREFKNPNSAGYFEACSATPTPTPTPASAAAADAQPAPQPFQCETRSVDRALSWKDFR